MSDTDAIKKIVAAYADAIHSLDTEELRPLWADGALCTLISIGTVFRGVDSICNDFLGGGIAGAYSSIDLIAEDVEVNLVDGDHATVIFRYHTECVRRATGEPYGIKGVETQVLVREGGAWKLQHVHYSKVS